MPAATFAMTLMHEGFPVVPKFPDVLHVIALRGVVDPAPTGLLDQDHRPPVDVPDPLQVFDPVQGHRPLSRLFVPPNAE